MAPETEAIVLYDSDAEAVAVPSALARDPELVLSEAQKAAAALKKVIDQKPSPVKFNGKTYLDFQDFQTLGRFYNTTAKVKGVRSVTFDLDEETKIVGFEAEAVAIRNGEEIGGASAMCLSDEPNWKTKPLFQLSSMAQTRAMAKALRSVLGWVVVLAGYEATPAEEMSAEPMTSTNTVKMPQRKSAPKPVPPVPSAVQSATGGAEILVNFQVIAIEEKEGASWHLTKAVTDTGLELSTFDHDLGLTLKAAKDTGARLTATWKREESKKKPGIFNNMVLTLEGAEEAAKNPKTFGEIFEG